MTTKDYVGARQARINQYLDTILPHQNIEPRKLHQAMRYAVLDGGKRLRPILTYAVGESLNAPLENLDHCSAAIELIHAFSLVHDDLPAIDNDCLRRGRPACHVAFGEATAILCGDALLALSFGLLANINKNISKQNKILMIKLLSSYIGSLGMAGGEELDTGIVNKQVTVEQLNAIYKLKTSYLISASLLLGALSANCRNKEILNNLKNFGLNIGLAFQIHDDIIGLESDSRTLGKTQGCDVINHKLTYPALLGMKKSKEEERKYFTIAINFLKKNHLNNERLIAISEYIITRNS